MIPANGSRHQVVHGCLCLLMQKCNYKFSKELFYSPPPQNIFIRYKNTQEGTLTKFRTRCLEIDKSTEPFLMEVAC